MCDWSQNEFMSTWDKTYVSTNLKAEAKSYNKDFFLGLNTRLVEEAPELRHLSYALIVRFTTPFVRISLPPFPA